MMSVYERCGRFEGVAYMNDDSVWAANYAHRLDEAFDLLMERYPDAKQHEVVEHEYEGFGCRVYTKGE